MATRLMVAFVISLAYSARSSANSREIIASKLPNSRTPDFLVQSDGVKCYVEAIARPDIRDQILDAFDGYEHKPYTLYISVRQSSEKAHLNRRRETARDIVWWAGCFYKAINASVA